MGTKSGSSFATLLLSVPLAAVALMALFGVPQFTPVIASPDETLVIRDPYESQPRHGMRDDQGQPREWYPDAFGENSASPADSSPSGSQLRRQPREQYPSPQSMSLNERSQQDHSRHQFADGDQPGQDRGQTRGSPRPDSLNQVGSESPAQSSLEFASQPRNPSLAFLEPGARSLEPGASSMTSRLVSWREASRRLAEMGIEHYHLERGVSEHSFLFVCRFSPGDAPHVTHQFEAEAEEPLVAVNQVLQQIDVWLQERFAAGNFPSGTNRL